MDHFFAVLLVGEQILPRESHRKTGNKVTNFSYSIQYLRVFFKVIFLKDHHILKDSVVPLTEK